ncbi:MAG TPA: cytochrome c3 family protein [Gemmatimonadales bacterium]|nr:cytochrome c3 family protein [Gemmatimonadales bacterium]
MPVTLLAALDSGVLAAVQDSGPVGLRQQAAIDSTIQRPHLSDPVITVVQWIFQRPPWLMWGGAVLAAIVAVLVARLLWRSRQQIGSWVRSRGLALQLVLAGLAALVLVLAAGMGYRTNQFVQHDNRFCNGCHIFVGSGEAWVLPDTGNYSLVHRLEGKHDTLSCHACHALKVGKEAVKLVFWMSGRREKEIPPHAKVPRDVCERCHVRGDARASWQAIASTAGHRTHLESDTLAGKVDCLTCHAQTAHRFQPVNATCAQQGCHFSDSVRIRLGRMANQTSMHCTACHQFTREVPALATRDSAAAALVPTMEQCASCHQMKALIADFNPARDPHKGTCGMCHNPHQQSRPQAALKSCASAGCHSNWRDEPFHVGLRHRAVAEQCQTCHPPHSARVDASDCIGCHNSVRERTRGRLRPPLPFDTTAALRRVSLGATVPASVRDSPGPKVNPFAPADSFSHSRHRRLPCLTCHTTSTGHGDLTFERPRGCQICHHQAPAASRCSTCHEANELLRSIAETVTVQVRQRPPRARAVGFAHVVHDSIACTTCHVTPVSLAPADSVTRCTECHVEHHQQQRDCSTCHTGSEIRPAHARPVEAHRNCDDCHTASTVRQLHPTRALCLTCHTAQASHFAERECVTCHFLASPDRYREHLTRKPTP